MRQEPITTQPAAAGEDRAAWLRRLARRPEPAILPAVVVLLWRVAAWRGHHLELDDAFISFRYARNLARGLGLVFNPGERVEGFTNFLWTVLLAGCQRLGFEPAAAAFVIAALAVVATLWLMSLLSRRLVADPVRAAALTAGATLAYAAMGIQARFVLSGMETPVFVLLTTLALYLEASAVNPALTGMVLGLATLTHPEGVVFLGVVAGYRLLAAPGPRRWLACARLAAGFLVVAGPFFWWRYAYYGYPLPNSFYVKVDRFSLALCRRGWTLLVSTVRAASLELPAALALVGLFAARRNRGWLLLFGCVLASCLFFTAVGGDFSFFFGPRFLLPALPPAFLLAAAGIGMLARPAPGRAGRAVVVAGLFAALVVNAFWFARPSRLAQLRDVVLLGRCWTEVGKWLAGHSPAGSTVAVGAVGMIPYYSERYTIDMLGLTDLHIAHLPIPLGRGIPGHEKHDDEYVLDRRPDYVVFARLDLKGRPFLVDWRRIQDRFAAEYRLVAAGKAVEGADPWVVEISELTPQLVRRGYRAAIYERRESAPRPSGPLLDAQGSQRIDPGGAPRR